MSRCGFSESTIITVASARGWPAPSRTRPSMRAPWLMGFAGTAAVLCEERDRRAGVGGRAGPAIRGRKQRSGTGGAPLVELRLQGGGDAGRGVAERRTVGVDADRGADAVLEVPYRRAALPTRGIDVVGDHGAGDGLGAAGVEPLRDAALVAGVAGEVEGARADGV